MEGSIPTHHLPASARFPTRVERILPVGDAVNNGVHRHDFHELFFFRSGTSEHMIDLGHHATGTYLVRSMDVRNPWPAQRIFVP